MTTEPTTYPNGDCWQRGPRVGDARPSCVEPSGHTTPHRADPSWGSVTWPNDAPPTAPTSPVAAEPAPVQGADPTGPQETAEGDETVLPQPTPGAGFDDDELLAAFRGGVDRYVSDVPTRTAGLRGVAELVDSWHHAALVAERERATEAADEIRTLRGEVDWWRAREARLRDEFGTVIHRCATTEAERDAERKRADKAEAEAKRLREFINDGDHEFAVDSCAPVPGRDCQPWCAACRVLRAGAKETKPHSGRSVLDDAWVSVWLHGRWRRLTQKMTTDEREAAADAVDRGRAALEPDEPYEPIERWWRDPAGVGEKPGHPVAPEEAQH